MKYHSYLGKLSFGAGGGKDGMGFEPRYRKPRGPSRTISKIMTKKRRKFLNILKKLYICAPIER